MVGEVWEGGSIGRKYTIADSLHIQQKLTQHWKAAMCTCAQSCLTLCDPVDCSPSGSSVHRVLQEVAMPSFRGSS